ncbi:MAG: S8 family serine peptidase [Erythrobacter sp.]|jgi:hypothetical protein|nr:S8 family serine peptidase [Erythrobacter sp.]
MTIRILIAWVLVAGLTFGPPGHFATVPLAAQDAGDGDDGDELDDDGDDGDDLDDPDDLDEPDGDDGADGDDLGDDGDDGADGDDLGDDGDDGADDDDSDDDSGDDDDTGGDDDDDRNDDDEGEYDDNENDGGDDENDRSDGQWEYARGETAAERAELDQRDLIDTDGEGFRYRRREFVALDLDDQDLAELRASGFEVVSREKLAVAGTLLLLRGPAELTGEAALDTLDAIADPDSIGYNHLFDSAAVQTTRKRGKAVPERIACGCDIGLIDTGVATNLDLFRHVTLTQRAFNGKTPQPRLHGTAVAHLMAGTKRNPGQQTRIFVADIFSGPRQTSGSSYALIKALDWLAAQGTPVINISLSGPRNAAVAGAIARITKRGHIVVAAAGNDGPAAPPVFPGAYEGVIGVTAVDAKDRVYRYANRGTYVDFAARGVAVTAIDAKGAVRDATGTSFAAPVVAARLAGQLRKPDAAASRQVVRKLEAEARDLGPRGRDPIFGAGLIGGN